MMIAGPDDLQFSCPTDELVIVPSLFGVLRGHVSVHGPPQRSPSHRRVRDYDRHGCVRTHARGTAKIP
jgi:hypothetical protein